MSWTSLSQLMMNQHFKQHLPSPAEALPGRPTPITRPTRHEVLDASLQGPWPEESAVIYLGLGCFWGAERLFWKMEGVHSTAVGYQGGLTENPTYEEVCSGRTGHNEVVMVVYFPAQLSTEVLLQRFWEAHDPTQGMRQGNDVGTQYRSAIYWSNEAQRESAAASMASYQTALSAAGLGVISTELRAAAPFYYAEAYHQQYLHKNPDGYCGLRGTGVACQHADVEPAR
ncbi:MAG: peptide-methionine (S)-S-oxide reductase MsrA [Myxococcota bacterium]|nr:peptide-methionine (S)-S-oxide reductase MsrA [Myxococcota bacterium]